MIRILHGSVASMNPLPDFSIATSDAYALPGRYEGQHQYPGIRISDEDLTKGLLFIGGAGCGKTNTMKALADQVLHHLGSNDIAVFFDMKGDYKQDLYNRELGDAFISATDNTFVWNLLDELFPFRKDPYRLEMRIKETAEYLFKGQESAEQPYFVNAGRAITEDLIKYLLRIAERTGDTSILNNKTLKQLILGPHAGKIDSYDAIRNVLMSYPDFAGELAFIPEKDKGDRSAYAVISEIAIMAGRTLAGAFGEYSREGHYLSPFAFAQKGGGHALFLEYDPTIPESQSPAFRLFIDNLIADRADSRFAGGKTYIFLDEFAMLPELQYLDKALAHFRSKGFCIIAGLQSVEQVRANYSEAKANLVLEAFQTVVAFKCENSSIRWLQDKTGHAVVQETYSGPNGADEIYPVHERPCIEDYEVLGLRTGEAFVKLGNKPVFKYWFDKTVIDN